MLLHGPSGHAASNKDEIKAKYEKKFAEVLKPGLQADYCSSTSLPGETRTKDVVFDLVSDDDVKVRPVFDCDLQWVKVGDILVINHVEVVRGGMLFLKMETTPHSLTRGLPAYEHQSIETGYLVIRFKSSSDPETLLSQWLRISDTVRIDKIGNTASMVQTKQIKAGMSFAQVEQELGVPVTRVDLGEKVIYKYKDMTVEFHDGKVTDVR